MKTKAALVLALCFVVHTNAAADSQMIASAYNPKGVYILLGGITGTTPGIPLPGGMVVLPVNWDLFTNIVIQLVNTPIFQNFMGVLDGQGSGAAQLNLGPVPGFAGTKLYFAYAMNNPWDFASNPVMIEIVP